MQQHSTHLNALIQGYEPPHLDYIVTVRQEISWELLNSIQLAQLLLHLSPQIKKLQYAPVCSCVFCLHTSVSLLHLCEVEYGAEC